MMKALKAQSKAGAASRLARMSKYAKGGKVSDGDADDKPMVKAKKPPAAMTVDGKPARARLDRPGRKMGRKGFWQGGYDDDKDYKEKAAELQSKSARLGTESQKEAAGEGAAMGLGAGAMLGARSKIGKLIGAGLAAYGASNLPSSVKKADVSGRMRKEAAEANKAGDEAVGRKSGGRAKR